MPVEPYLFAEWRIRRVGIDYHVDIDRHYYSVPYRFARQAVEARVTGRTIEVFAKGGIELVAVEVTEAAAEHGRENIESSTARAVSRGKLAEDDRTALLERVRVTTGMGELADVALVVAETLERPGLAGAVVEFNTGPRPVVDELDATPTAI